MKELSRVHSGRQITTSFLHLPDKVRRGSLVDILRMLEWSFNGY